MIVKQYIKDFEQLGFGMFVHFGVYSQQGSGEWLQALHGIPAEQYQKLADTFLPKERPQKKQAANISTLPPATMTVFLCLIPAASIPTTRPTVPAAETSFGNLWMPAALRG